MSSTNQYPDLSGISEVTANPYDALLNVCNNDCNLISERYAAHRQKRNSQQKALMLDPAFRHLNIDSFLQKLVSKDKYPGYADPRHCLVFWARPTRAVKHLIKSVQDKLTTLAPNLWLMPQDNLHMTTLEITHSLTEAEITSRVHQLTPKLEQITDYTYDHRTRLSKPMVSFDASALALSFVPSSEDRYTYHHLRKDVYDLCKSTGVEVESRYVVPSAHLTIARYVDYKDLGDIEETHVDSSKVKSFIEKIEEINDWLAKEHENFEWTVGEEKGLDCNRGTLWYGEGQRLRLGKGF